MISWYRYGWHSLIAAYGIDADKVVFIPHGVNVLHGPGHARRLQSEPEVQENSRVRELLAKAGEHEVEHICLKFGLEHVSFSIVSAFSMHSLSQWIYLVHPGVKDDSQIILSNGLINQAKRLDRIVQAFPQVLAKYPNSFFLILGREHPTEPLAGQQAMLLLC